MKLKKNIRQLLEVFKLLLPQDKQEIFILIFFMLFYLSYSVFISLNTSAIDFTERSYDVYFSYDNPIVYEREYVYMSGHPLMKYMTMPFILFGDFLAILFGPKAKTLFSSIVCSSLISLSIVYIYRYLRVIVKLNGRVTCLLIGLYGFSMTCLTLCFTPESFTISAFLLSFMVYFYSYYIQSNRNITLATNILFPVILGGITITNFVKGIIPMLFMKINKKQITRRLVIVVAVFAVILICAIFEFRGQLIAHYINNTTTTTKGTAFEDLFGMLFSSPIFSSFAVLVSAPEEESFPYMILFEYYRYWWQYFFTGILFLLIIVSIARNYRNKLVVLLVLLVTVDVFIHVFMRFGMGEGFLYGGHWLFFVPLMLGWGYKSIKSDRVRMSLSVFLGILLVVLIGNNIIQLIRFIDLAVECFPPY